MPLFNETLARSAAPNGAEEIANVYTTRDILTNCAALRLLLEVSNPSDAGPLIIVGESEPPQNGESYTIGEMEGRIAFCQLFPKLTQGSLLVSRNTGGASPKKEGYFWLHVRRQVRQSEYLTVDGRNDVFKYFWFLTSRMAEEFVVLTDESVSNPGVVEKQMRRDGIGYNMDHQPTWPEFGYFVFANFLIPWGGVEGGE